MQRGGVFSCSDGLRLGGRILTFLGYRPRAYLRSRRPAFARCTNGHKARCVPILPIVGSFSLRQRVNKSRGWKHRLAMERGPHITSVNKTSPERVLRVRVERYKKILGTQDLARLMEQDIL